LGDTDEELPPVEDLPVGFVVGRHRKRITRDATSGKPCSSWPVWGTGRGWWSPSRWHRREARGSSSAGRRFLTD
jgi:hypothetical protein